MKRTTWYVMIVLNNVNDSVLIDQGKWARDILGQYNNDS